MRFIILLVLAISLCGCKGTPSVDFTTGTVTACTNKYDVKDDIVFYDAKKSEYLSQSTGVMQMTFVDIFNHKRMLNEFELDNYVCVPVTSNEQVNSILND